MTKRPYFALLYLAVLLIAGGCKEATLAPDLTGSIDGVVLDQGTQLPIAGAGVTTSPPTSAIVTNEEGAFEFPDVAEGNYTITASRPGFKTNSATVTVRENRSTRASLFLKKDAKGAIEGFVLDAVTQAPLAAVRITTTPPTSAVQTDGDGRFRLDDLTTGSYTIRASRSGFTPDSVSVSVEEGKTTDAKLFLEQKAPDPQASVSVDVTGWQTRVSGDSAYARVEYRVRNTGAVKVRAYEAYFRIRANGQDFYQEERGDELEVGQTDVGVFEKYTLETRATEVVVDNVWVGQ